VVVSKEERLDKESFAIQRYPPPDKAAYATTRDAEAQGIFQPDLTPGVAAVAARLEQRLRNEAAVAAASLAPAADAAAASQQVKFKKSKFLFGGTGKVNLGVPPLELRYERPVQTYDPSAPLYQLALKGFEPFAGEGEGGGFELTLRVERLGFFEAPLMREEERLGGALQVLALKFVRLEEGGVEAYYDDVIKGLRAQIQKEEARFSSLPPPFS
jgi:hypothetical protein